MPSDPVRRKRVVPAPRPAPAHVRAPTGGTRSRRPVDLGRPTTSPVRQPAPRHAILPARKTIAQQFQQAKQTTGPSRLPTIRPVTRRPPATLATRRKKRRPI